MKSFFGSILFFILFVLLCIGATFGVLRPEHSSVSAVGPLQVAAYDNGISLFQNFRGQFYTDSPYNDYFISENGIRTSFIDMQEIIDNSYTTSFAKPEAERIFESVGNYLGLITPEITYYTKNKTIKYSTAVFKNELTISRVLNLSKNTPIKKLATTLSFSSGDIIYDQNGTLYTYAPDTIITLFKQTYGITLTPSLNDLMIQIPGKALYVYNPNVAGVLMIQAEKNQSLIINRNAKLIEVEQSVLSKTVKTYTTAIHITTFSNPKEAYKSL